MTLPRDKFKEAFAQQLRKEGEPTLNAPMPPKFKELLEKIK